MIKTKVCSTCKKELSLGFFYKNKSKKNGLSSQCKECYRKYKKNHRKEISEYNKEYHQNNKEKISKCDKKYGQTSSGIYTGIKRSARKRNIQFEISQEEFINWYENQELKCTYCNILQKLLKLLKWGRKNCRNHIQTDRKDNDKGYTLDNICLACDVCNVAKSDNISFEEMLKIGKTNQEIWQQRFKKIGE